MLDVAIVGSGLAGMEAALRLRRPWRRVAVFEKEATPGGLAQTRRVQDCLVDREFQTVSEISRRMGERQQWFAFAPDIFFGGLDEGAWADGSPLATDWEGQQIGEWLGGFSHPDYPWEVEVRSKRPIMILRYGEEGAARYFDNVVTPLLHAVLDWPEEVSNNQVSDAARAWLYSKELPASGLGGVTRRHVERTKGLVSCGQEVCEVRSGASPGVVLASGESVDAKAVIVATDEWTSLSLTGLVVPYWTKVTCWFRGPAPDDSASVRFGWVASGRVLNTAVMSNVNPAYAAEGALMVATVLLDPGEELSLTAVTDDLSFLYGVDASGWDLIWRSERRVPRGPRPAQEHPGRGVVVVKYPIVDHFGARVAGAQAARAAKYYR